MAHKSKTQRAKATAAKANKKERQQRDESVTENTSAAVEKAAEETKGGLFKKKEKEPEVKKQAVAATKKEEKPKKVRFQFLKDVRAEMKRVTWPTRQDVVRWTGVVVGALVFFGVYVAILDYAISNGLVALSGLGA